MWLLLFIFHLLTPHSYAVENQSLYWAIVRHEHHFESGQLGSQLQLRHSQEEGQLVEEQINLDWTWQAWDSEIALLFTFGTQDGFEKLRELRYALQWQKDIYESSRFEYNLRLRQEVRDFDTEPSLAYRFRLRNEIMTPLSKKWFVELSSEFNWYQNELNTNDSGFSSHRSILSFNQWLSTEQFYGFSYVNDYRESKTGIIVRHILAFSILY